MSYLPHKDDNYLAPLEYFGKEIDKDGFSTFQHEENKEYYFAFFMGDKLILRSEGYDQAAGRDHGMEVVKELKDDDKYYNIRQHPDGKWVLELRARNNKEVARTPRVDTKVEAVSYMPSKLKEGPPLEPVPMELPEKKRAKDDDYLACHEYENQPRSEDLNEFTLFSKGNEYYFALVDDLGQILLRGEGYMSKEARKNGMNSVLKNKGDKTRYKVVEHLDYHFVLLRAANNQEIARSCAKSAEEAAALIATLTLPPVPATPLAAVEGATDIPPAEHIPTLPSKEQGIAWWMWVLIIIILAIILLLLL